MISNIRKIRDFYRTLSSNTRLVIRISVITVVCTLSAAIYSYTAANYNLLKISDYLLELTRTSAYLGFAATLLTAYIERERKKEN